DHHLHRHGELTPPSRGDATIRSDDGGAAVTLPPPPPGAGPPRTPPAGADPIAAPPAPVDPGRSAYLVLDLRHHRLNHLMRTVTPVISVNGCPVPGRWGRNEVPVPSGRSHVH